MQITVPLFSSVSIKFSTHGGAANDFPTARLQKGFHLLHEGQDLAEEGVGFGVPVLKRGMETIFSGSAEMVSVHGDALVQVAINFKMNLEEKIARPGGELVNNRLLYRLKNLMAALIRRIPPLRGLLTATSNGLRHIFAWQTTFEEARFCTMVTVVYTVDCQAGIITVELDPSSLAGQGITEVVVMHEQGARSFNLYRDAGGAVLRDEEIGCWDPVKAQPASFVSEAHCLAFTIQQPSGATVFRGRELIGTRLAWSGFGCSFPVPGEKISCQLKIERLQ